MKAIVYCRVSSKEQVEGTSLESQESACREFAQSKNIEILKVFIEQGESAKFADRTQLLELLDFCKKNKGSVNALIVWKVDRFARNVTDHFSVKSTLVKYGVRIMSVTEPIDTNPEGKLMETILAGFAQFDNDIRAMRTMQGMRRKIREGISPWRPPLGYKSPVMAREKKNAPDVPDEPAFSLLRRAFTEFATGAHTQMDMNRLMNSWGLVAARGRSLAPQSLFGLFTNQYYAGILVDPWSGEEIQGKHPPLVSREIFARVQRVINVRRRPVAHVTERNEFPLRGFVRCDTCNHALTGAYSRGRSSVYPYYSCHMQGCPKRGKSIPADAAHSEFTSFLEEITPRPELVNRIGESAIAMVRESKQEFSAHRKRVRKRIEELEKETGELIRMRAQSLITDEEFLRQKRHLLDQRMALESQPRHDMDLAQVEADIQKLLEPLANLRRTWATLAPHLRTRFNRLMLPAGFLIGNVRTADRGLVFSTFLTCLAPDSGKVPFTFVQLNPLLSEITEFSRILSSTGSKFEGADRAVQRAA
jgi:DNA invertase Pin-like site-specific DNA recombinase